MTDYTVVFQDRARRSEVLTNGRPVILPQTLVAVEESEDRLVLEPAPSDDGLGGADAIAGAIPLICYTPAGPEVFWLEIPPPAPLTMSDLEAMWSEVVGLGVPPPASISAQGRMLPGELSPARQIAYEYVVRAHQACRQLLVGWPKRPATTVRWQHLELPGGREDPALTARHAGRLTGIESPAGHRLPVRSARSVHLDLDWRSNRLAISAHALAEALMTQAWRGTERQRRAFVRPFVDLASRATPLSHHADPPLSAWPTPAKFALEAVLSALAAVNVVSTDRIDGVRAPLCYIWRLYEAWVAARTARILDGLDGWERVSPPAKDYAQNAPTCEWIGTWQGRRDSRRIHVTAQLEVGKDPSDLNGRSPFGIYSVTSYLIPDVCLVMVDGAGGRAGLLAVDAKRRAQMLPRDAAEAASKYVWGLRLDTGRGDDEVQVGRVILATTATPPQMYSPAGRISAVLTLPSNSVSYASELENALKTLRMHGPD